MIYAAVALIIFLGDFFLKKYIETHMEPKKHKSVCGGRIVLHRYHNRGAALNFLEKSPNLVRNLCGGLLLALGIVWALLLRKKDNPGVLLGLSFLLGGGGSNLCDRIAKGYVVDYFSFRTPFPWINRVVFNISDFMIFLGSILVAVARK